MNLKKVISASLLFAVLTGIGYALTPPPVNQNTGLYDTSIDFLITNSSDQSACRSCHQTSDTSNSGGYNNTIGGVPTRHHNLLQEDKINPYTGTTFVCKDCHPSTAGNVIVLDRSCIDCHNGTSFYANNIGANVGNFSRPHHVNTSYDDANIGQPAQNRTCNVCHGSFVENYNDGHYRPSGNTSFYITPYATFKATNFSQPDGLGGNKVWGGCHSCHLPNPAAVPPIGSNYENHHKEILGFAKFGGKTPFQNISTPFVNVNNICSVCHVIDYTNLTGYGNTFPLRMNLTNPFTGEFLINAMEIRNSSIEQADAAIGAFEPGTVNVTINGTGCEKCHSVQSLHNIQVNYSGPNSDPGYGHIGNTTDCNGCHAYWGASSTLSGDSIPNMNNVTPSVIITGISTTITITGSNFGNDSNAYSIIVDGLAYAPISVQDSQIQVTIPALTIGIHQLQLVHNGNIFSKLSTLTVVPNVHITSARYKGGTITITGTGFGTIPVNAQYYVSVNHSGQQTISTIISWSDNQIKAKNSVATIGDLVTVVTANSGETTATITK